MSGRIKSNTNTKTNTETNRKKETNANNQPSHWFWYLRRCVPRGSPGLTTSTSTSRSTVATEALAPSSTPSNDDQQPQWRRTITSTINNITNLPAEGSSSKASRDLKVPRLPVVIKIQCCSALHLFTIALNYCYIETTLVFSFTSSDTSAYMHFSIIKRRLSEH